MEILENQFRGGGMSLGENVPFPSTNIGAVRALLSHCPAAKETPLEQAESLAQSAGVGAMHVKDERHRMGLGSFKALGAAYVIACDAAEAAGDGLPDETTLSGRTYITASAGNHGLSVAAGARIFGAKAIVFLSENVPEAFKGRLEALGATVYVEGSDYQQSMDAAMAMGEEQGFTLLSDTSWDAYLEPPHPLTEGYLAMSGEAVEQLGTTPTHIFLQAGVGGLACSVAAYARHVWGDEPMIVVVEPTEAPALHHSIHEGRLATSSGGVSSMGRLDCKEASLIALNGLARDADYFMLLSDEEVENELPLLAGSGLETSPSGGAGLVGALVAGRAGELGLNKDSVVLTCLSEGPA